MLTIWYIGVFAVIAAMLIAVLPHKNDKAYNVYLRLNKLKEQFKGV